MKTNASNFFQRSILLVIALLLAASAAAYFALQKDEISSSARSYSMGDTATEDVVASQKISWFDPMETEARRQRELSKGPVLFRLEENVSAQSVARFNKEFSFARESFLESVEKNFKTRALDSNQVDSPLFRKLVVDFRREHAPFPITLVEATRWVQGDAEEKLQKQLAEKLRVASEKFVHPDDWPAAAHGDHLRVIASDELAGTNVNLPKQSRLVRRTNIVGITKARGMLQGQFPKKQQTTGKFLAGFVEVNCVFDEELTRQLRAQRADSIRVVNSFQEGQTIVRRGEKIDARIKAALDELPVRQPPVLSKTNGPNKIWLGSAAVFLVALALVIILRSAFRPGHQLVSAQNVVVLPRMKIEAQTLETKLIPHLARGLMNKLVQRLISQRSQLMETQTSGTEHLNELEQRLAQINTRLQTRQIACEKRIAELEKELAVAEEENRELIRAKIREVRQNLEWAKAQAGQR